MTTKKISVLVVIVIVIVALAILFFAKLADQRALAPTVGDVTPSIPDNMAISEELGG